MKTFRPSWGLCKLLFSLFCIWLLLWVITPLWVAHSPLHQKFAAAQDYYDVPIGALYYNDIPFIGQASMELRDTWRYLPRGPKPLAKPLASPLPAAPDAKKTQSVQQKP